MESLSQSSIEEMHIFAWQWQELMRKKNGEKTEQKKILDKKFKLPRNGGVNRNFSCTICCEEDWDLCGHVSFHPQTLDRHHLLSLHLLSSCHGSELYYSACWRMRTPLLLWTRTFRVSLHNIEAPSAEASAGEGTDKRAFFFLRPLAASCSRATP